VHPAKTANRLRRRVIALSSESQLETDVDMPAGLDIAFALTAALMGLAMAARAASTKMTAIKITTMRPRGPGRTRVR
jgi:hypothetical protein